MLLTFRSRHLFSLMAPRQPRKPVTMTIAPMAMTMLAADSEGNEGEKVAKLPCDTESQMPTPSSPQPHNCKAKRHDRRQGEKTHRLLSVQSDREIIYNSSPFLAAAPAGQLMTADLL